MAGETSGNKTTFHIMDTNKVDTSLPGDVRVGSGIKFNGFTVVR